MRDIKDEFESNYYREERARRAGFGDWFMAISGALILGVGFPVALVNVSYGFHSLFGSHGQQDPEALLSLGQRLGEMLQLMFAGALFCSPGVVVLGSAVFSISIADVRKGTRWREVLLGAWALGGLLSFLNLPGYLCLELLGTDMTMRVVKVVILFLVAGVAAGTWISRVAWRVIHPRDPILPAFSLKSLLGLVLVWAAIMAVFAPR